MNYAEKMEMESRILGNVARWMERRGKVLADRKAEQFILRHPGFGGPLERNHLRDLRG